ncbi:putative ribonuclease H1 [Talaromyces proteolyticus]|uniref:ribonuclease H n=1 Tax=Talaromyces proteolyticus TaxID=1131652 RepID=A0AAD4PU38_9EURO|nr:putative ribonuclease H1 [Talaromyces proteolyticus]KAH8688864.1 putative ribonuclease H1 [Talaromyces proteolyticus]
MGYIMEIYVDGGCRRNGLPGSIGAASACIKNKWGKYKCFTRDLNSASARPTNQRAEITAIILALELALEKFKELDSYTDFHLEIFSDSKYATGCMTEWIYKWCRNGWTNAAGYEVTNRDLIERASDLDDRVKEAGSVTYTWIPRADNQVADQACNDALDRQQREGNYYYGSSDDDSDW